MVFDMACLLLEFCGNILPIKRQTGVLSALSVQQPMHGTPTALCVL